MGSTIWVLARSRRDQGDDCDHTHFLESAEKLDALAEEIGERKLSDFFDWSDFEFNNSDEPLPESWISEHEEWHAPRDALPSLRAIIARLKHDGAECSGGQDHEELIHELEDCLGKIENAQAQKDTFQFCVVM